MKLIASRLFLVSVLAACLPAHAATYICNNGGRAVFSTEKIGRNCKLSQMNGISDTRPADVLEERQPVDQIEQIWEVEQFGAYDDIKILPSQRNNGITNTVDAVSAPVEIKLRNQPRKSPRKPRVPAPVVSEPAKPKFSRTQILQNEIRNEQTALVRTQAQLNVARKKGEKEKIIRLEQAVRDRQANIRAILNEMKR
ncbi:MULTISPECIES: hypothetical protein [unclassified Neisseria]|uniref:hypothetical protein n=1 Tax=unclassified Neisseria TaxID=2623750 RepID=UPI002666F111|nr:MULTISPECIES: hypothetical protein [unclassified Neisseria]MDO1509726.1 hypothetical protein [Neisseria sp. MVDL19-042950]MDO1515950.1 hypothetical protein [Neisseria sp. MVDL18-041461]MDO1563063.1 hypothetical protein [Neisseria sp. MVDL20-010259]